MHEVNDRSRDIGEFVPAPDDDMLICRCEESLATIPLTSFAQVCP